MYLRSLHSYCCWGCVAAGRWRGCRDSSEQISPVSGRISVEINRETKGAINDTFGGKHRKAVEPSSALVNCEVVSLQSVYMEHSGLKHSTIFLHKIFFVQCYEPIFYWRTRLSYSYVSIPFSSCQLLKGQLFASSSCDGPQLPGDQTLKETLELQV